MNDNVSINVDNINIKYNNGDVIYIDTDGLHAPYRCGMCGNLIGYIDGFSFDKNLTRAIKRKTKVDGVCVCDDCYDMIKHISNYVRKIKE